MECDPPASFPKGCNLIPGDSPPPASRPRPLLQLLLLQIPGQSPGLLKAPPHAPAEP